MPRSTAASFSHGRLPTPVPGLRDLKLDLAGVLPGNTSISGMSSLLETVERQRFAASLTLIALAATTTLTLLFFVSLMMSYVVGARRSDVGKLSALGAGRWRILNLYGAEALAVTLGAAVSAPLLAFAAVLAAVMLPIFHPYRGNSPVPVEWVHWSFVGAAGVGALCFCILSLPPLFGAGAGQLSRRFRWVRAPTTLLFQKYHVDTFLLVLGGLFYWEIHSRGDLIAGGLFRDSNVNEILFVAPVLLVLLVGLLFVRLFPLALRFAAGESAALLDVVAIAHPSPPLLLLPCSMCPKSHGGRSWLCSASRLRTGPRERLPVRISGTGP